MIEVLIIGVNPPCPRCDIVHKWADEFKTEFSGQMTVKNLYYDSQEAQDFGRKLGMKVGTAKDVSRETSVALDLAALNMFMANRVLELDDEPERPADLWAPEMDAILKPCEMVASTVRWLMTPVIAISGVVKHQGSVPDREQIRKWVSEAIFAKKN